VIYSLANTALLCSYHHRELHEGGCRIERETSGELKFITKFGLTVDRVPPSPNGSPESLERDQRHLDIRAQDLLVWDGTPLDYHFTIAELLRLDGRELPCERERRLREAKAFGSEEVDRNLLN
jgi:hypothetical protein